MFSIRLRIASLLCTVLAQPSPDYRQDVSQWSGWGGSYLNDRHAQNSELNSTTLKSLQQRCRYDVAVGTSAPPATQDSIAYFTTYGGLLIAYDYVDCKLVWRTNVTDIIYQYGQPTAFQLAVISAVSRSSPQIGDGVLYIATLIHALLLAFDPKTGKLLATTQVHPHPYAQLTMSPTYYNGRVFIGTSSAEETAALLPNYTCCSFAGTFAAFSFDHSKGKFTTEWNVTLLPEPLGVDGWNGAAVWGSQPSIDSKRQQVFIATGNTYELPDSVVACINATKDDDQDACYPEDAQIQAVVALDIRTGRINWSSKQSPLQAWTAACGVPGFTPKLPTCPADPGPDADFGMAPSFISASHARTPNHSDVVVTGQKSGVLFAMDAANGSVYWATLTSPDSSSNGALTWGVAVDSEKVYFTGANPAGISWETLPSGKNISNSAYGAVSLLNGTFLWETSVPHNYSSLDPPTVVNDLVLVGRNYNYNGGALAPANSTGSVVILNTAGKVLQEIEVDTVMWGGIAVLEKHVLVGTGYRYGSTGGAFIVYELCD
ncbi:hypothetical protein LTR78_000875 [Recurvomyces mirabilis]|uniref:Pyrrolo-quinoline quinone repeat domain-containing protein n=1 Tax=Recurvomyces mirabilis TaxID=574656 RepID=A0AAE1C5Y0_9PEZI|nr:hypothetical protein LTR78_000875 [Recurvomyces mirabilis]KAK5158846.1 hypothetical protein LTS14_002954 [Recurvomyces mirabilis]